eukprot:327622-Hanusia_phi.AAC.2
MLSPRGGGPHSRARRLHPLQLGRLSPCQSGGWPAARSRVRVGAACEGRVTWLELRFVISSKKWIEKHEDLKFGNLTGKDLRKVFLMVAVMTLHSFSEGLGTLHARSLPPARLILPVPLRHRSQLHGQRWCALGCNGDGYGQRNLYNPALTLLPPSLPPSLLSSPWRPCSLSDTCHAQHTGGFGCSSGADAQRSQQVQHHLVGDFHQHASGDDLVGFATETNGQRQPLIAVPVFIFARHFIFWQSVGESKPVQQFP